MTDSFAAALVGAVTAIMTSIIASWVGISAIRAEYKAKYHSELIERQILACEKLWGALSIASRTGDPRIITTHESGASISVECATKIFNDLIDIFNSPSGLYFSKNLRNSIFGLRDFLYHQIILKASNEKVLIWSKTKASDLDGYIQNLRNAIRCEVGVEDLKVAKLNRPG